MTLKEQWKTIKDNWIIALIVLILIIMPFFSGSGTYQSLGGDYFGSFSGVRSLAMQEKAVGADYMALSPEGGNFAPEVESRKITKTSSIRNEIDRGKFYEAEERLKAIISSTDSILLNENVDEYGSGRQAYLTGIYTFKVDSTKYEAAISLLKEIGKIQSFNENALDITDQHQDLSIEIQAEKARLERFKTLLEEATRFEDKIVLTDRIYDLERRINYLKDALENVERKVEYSTVTVYLEEEPSGYADIAVVKFSELVRKVVDSFNSLLSLIFLALPYAAAAAMVWALAKIIKERAMKKKQ